MQFFSTRDAARQVSASQAIVQGLSDEGGLFVPQSFPQVDVQGVCQLEYPAMAAAVLRDEPGAQAHIHAVAVRDVFCARKPRLFPLRRAELPLGKEVRELLGAAPAAEPDAVSVPLRRTGYSTTDILTLKEKSV